MQTLPSLLSVQGTKDFPTMAPSFFFSRMPPVSRCTLLELEICLGMLQTADAVVPRVPRLSRVATFGGAYIFQLACFARCSLRPQPVRSGHAPMAMHCCIGGKFQRTRSFLHHPGRPCSPTTRDLTSLKAYASSLLVPIYFVFSCDGTLVSP